MNAESQQGQLTPQVGDSDHIQGQPTASLTLVEYGDFQCPYCGEAYPIVKAVQQEIGPELRLVFRNFPLAQIHSHAELAAEAAEAAAAQGKYWEMHDMLFENQKALRPNDLVDYAKSLDLDVEKFEQDLEQRLFAQKVRDDFMSGVRSGVNGTPTFFVNGQRYNASWDYASLLANLSSVLQES